MLVPIERVLRSTVVIAFRVANGLITDIHFRREDGIGDPFDLSLRIYTPISVRSNVDCLNQCDYDFKSMEISLDLRQLRCFLAVAEHLHFGHAARAMHLSQPALSQQIRALEQEIGVPLFLRDRRKTSLTPAGLALVEDAQAILSRSKQAVRHAQRAALGEVGTLQLGFISTAAALLVPPLVIEFKRRYPGVSLELRNVLTGDQLPMLSEGSLDVGFLRVPVASPTGIVTTVIHREPFVLLVPVRHRLAGRKPFTLTDLRDEEFILYTRKLAAGYHDRILAMLNSAGFTPKVAQLTSEMYTMVCLVAAGQGIAIAPASIQLHHTAGVFARALPADLPQSEIAVAVNEEMLSPAGDLFLKLVLKMSAGGEFERSNLLVPRAQ